MFFNYKTPDHYPNTISKEELEKIKSAKLYDGYTYEGLKKVSKELTIIVDRVNQNEETKYVPYFANPRYIISNTGMVYDRAREHFIGPTRRDGDVYNSYMVHHIEGVGNKYLHQLVAESFLKDGRDPSKEVNHDSGNKYDNRVCNLEMMTHEENVAHAVEHGLYKRKNTINDESLNDAERVHTKGEIIRICQLIIEGKSNREIAETIMKEFGLSDYTEGYVRIIRYCSPIYQPKEWEIVKQYKDQFPDNGKRRYSEEDIENMCKLLSENKDPKEIAEILDLEDTKEFRATLSNLRSRNIYDHITAKYPNIGLKNKRKFTDDEATTIYLLAHKGYKSPEIAKELGIEKSPSFATIVNQIKTGKSFSHIHEKYKDIIDKVPGYQRFSDDQIESICMAMAKGLRGKEVAEAVGMEYSPKFLQTICDLKSGRIYPAIAMKYGLVKEKGFDPDLAHTVCKMLQDRISVLDISKKLGVNHSKIRRLVEGMRAGAIFKDIYSQYDDRPATNKLTTEQVEKIYLLSTKGFKPAVIAEKLGIQMSRSFASTVSNIRSGKAYSDITKKYDYLEMPKFTSANHPSYITLEQAEKIYLLYHNGTTPSEIAFILNMEYTPTFTSAVHRIKNGKMYPEIHAKYNKG